jgi:hypothetical protein
MKDSKLRVGRTLFALLLVYALFRNLTWHGPYIDRPFENYLAKYRACTEISIGWPLPYFSRYPQGYVNPSEWLAWDVEPVFESWHPVSMVTDLFFAGFFTACLISTLRCRGFFYLTLSDKRIEQN